MMTARRFKARATLAGDRLSTPSGAGGGGSPYPPANFSQMVTDPGFASAPAWTLAGSGIGTSAVAGGVLQITSTDNVYTAVPATALPLPGGIYTVVFTILNYVTGSISIAASAAAALSSSTDGTTRSANGTYTQNIFLAAPGGFIGLKGQGAAVVNSMQIDNFTITRAA